MDSYQRGGGGLMTLFVGIYKQDHAKSQQYHKMQWFFFGYFQKKTKLTSIGFEVAPLNPLKLILVNLLIQN